MVTFLGALATLIIGYLVYGALVDRVFGRTGETAPAVRLEDGVDYIPLPTWKVFLIQLLNIAGLGPIFGALAGALWGPSVYLWIVFGTIFAGGVHDFLSGMISFREDGKSISEIVGKNLGHIMLQVMRVFSIVLLVLVGVVFMTGPAMLLAKLTGLEMLLWLAVIFIYYTLATLLPIDQIIARFYPLFGICLIVMALGIMGGMLFGVGGHTMPEMTLENLHPKNLPIWPLLFITVACGAVSGFHATQSPIMARCLKDEKMGRPVFYGAMVAEGIIALCWAAAGVTFYDSTAGLGAALKEAGPGGVVRVPLRAADPRRLVGYPAKRGVEASHDRRSHARHRFYPLADGFFHHLEILLVGKPDPRHDYALDGHGVSLSAQTWLLRLHHRHAARYLHVGGHDDVHPAGARGLWTADRYHLSCRHRLCRTLYRTLLPCIYPAQENCMNNVS